MIRNTNEAAPDIRELKYQLTGVANEIFGQGGILDVLGSHGQTLNSLLVTRAETPAAPVANLLWNGELGHSVFTWVETAGPPTGDKNEECAWFFSHNKPATLQTFVDANVSAANDTITLTGHNYTTGCTVDLTNSGGALPAGLATATTYFVIYVDANTIKLASSVTNAFAGTAVNITAAAGGGTHTIQQKLITTTAATSATNNELKTTAHSTYNLRYSRWDGTNGWAELTGTMSVDALIPSNLVDASTPLARVGLIAAKRNSYIEIPEDCLLSCGIWDNTSGQRKFLTGDVGFTATLVGTAGATERRFKVLLTSDRGFSILSNEVTIANAPADGAFSSTSYISMSWARQAGQLQVDIYEYLPGSGTYRLLSQVSSATSYIHLGSYLSTEAGYPSSTGTALSATFSTRTGEMADLATNGVSASWNTIILPNEVPSTYNKGNTTDRQFVRLWLTVAPNLYITGCTTNGTVEITAPTAGGSIPTAFPSEYATLFSGGLTAEVYDSNGTLITTTTTVGRVSDTVLELATSIATGTGRQIRIVGGGFHGVYVDKIHLGYQQNTSYAPNPLDVRTLQPRAAPSSSSQGGVGGGGGDDGGIILCVADDTPVKLAQGGWMQIGDTRPGYLWAGGHLKENILIHLKPGFASVRRVRSANGCEVYCTDTERFIVFEGDEKGMPLMRLRVGDPVLTEIDGFYQQSTISEISGLLPSRRVLTPTLSDNHLFIAGRIRFTGLQKVWHWLKRIALRRGFAGGFVLHNAKLPPLD